METCLFTGEPLTPDTKVEHTIPESLGGRIKSQVVTSDTFNNLCGTRVDFILKLPYEPMLNRLAPLLPRTSQPGLMPIKVPSDPPGLALEGGAVTRPKLLIVKDERGRPKTGIADDEEGLRKFARSMKQKFEEMRLSTAPATEATTFYRKVPIICREIEIAALKSAVLTFDHMLRGSPDQFTRGSELKQVREFIRDAVLTERPDENTLGELSFGLQYERRALYDRLRDQVNVPRTEFEHVLFASTRGGGQALQVVWLVFGFDPFGFQLGSWLHAPFSYAVINPVLREEGYTGPHRLPDLNESLCVPTDRCSMPWNMKESDDPQPILDEVSRERHTAFRRAVKLVEMTADRTLVGCFGESGELAKPEYKSVRQQVCARLVRMYGRKSVETTFLDAVDATLARHDTAVLNGLLTRAVSGLGDEAPEWSSVLGYYRRCLTDLELNFGLPGDPFTNSSGYVVDPADQRRLGQLPPMGE